MQYEYNYKKYIYIQVDLQKYLTQVKCDFSVRLSDFHDKHPVYMCAMPSRRETVLKRVPCERRKI